jgi:tetratricopeptide (TPR) repeat protein
MPDDRYIVLLNDALKSHLLHMSSRERGRLREKFEFLENGFWDAGVRVKKLKGTAGRVVFEARLNKSDRLLFTLGDHRGRTAIYVWGIASHDDISAEASRIAPRNAPFLDFEPLDREERSDLSLDKLPREWRSQEDVEQKVPEDYGPQRWLVLDEGEWRRLLASPNPDSFESFLFLTREQEALLAAPPPVLLSGTAGSGKTTLSIYYLLRGASSGSRRLFLTYNPLLKSLAERIHAGLMEKRGGSAGVPAPRFMVFRDLLAEITGASSPSGPRDFPPDREVGLREFVQIFNDHKDRRKFDAELVWEEIRSIIKGSKLPLNPKRYAALAARFLSRELSASERGELREYLIGLQELSIGLRAGAFIERRTSLGDYGGFLREMARGSAGAAEDCARVLDEVLRLAEKSASDFASPLLSVDEYLALGKKRAPAFLYDRREIHAIAEYYQERLVRSGRWDEIDLSKAALRRMDGAVEEFSWDLVVCDEVQDLTDVQVSLIFRLASDPRGVVLTGDPRQIINPSGFRWEEVKNKLYERGLPVPPVHRLSLNFRCVGSIVRLSNALLDLKAGLVGLADTEMREEWKFGGRPPLLLAGLSESEVLERIDFRAAGQAILTRTAGDRDALKKALATELVFTIAEAKGLEFDTVFLWRFCGDRDAGGAGGAEEIWRSIGAGQGVERARVPHLRHELALLYVAVTRARNTLILYDGEAPSVIWSIGSLAPLVFRTAEKERLAELWRVVSSPAQWDAQGEYYLAHGHFAAAGECFRNAGNEGRFSLASAQLLKSEGEFAAAAPLFEASGERRQAAECLERSGDWGGARRLWKALGDRERERLCAARVYESEGNSAKAAREWEAIGDTARALDCWEKAGAYERVGRAYAAAGEYGRAAPLLEKAKLPLEAAACLVKLGQEAKAADLYFRAGEFKQAARLYKKSGNDERLLRCYRQLGDDLAIAQYFEGRGDARKAVAAFAQFAGASEANREALLGTVPQVKSRRSALKAALRYSALSMPDKAGPLFLQAGERTLAAGEMERAGDYRGLAACREEMGQYLKAARALEESGLDDRALAEKLQSLLYAHLTREAPDDREAAEALYAEARRMQSDGRLAPALARFRLLQDDQSAREVFSRLGWHEDALRYFLETQSPAQALLYAKGEVVSLSTDFVESLLQEHWGDQRGSGSEGELVELFTILLEKASDSAPSSDSFPGAALARLTEQFFFRAFGLFVDEERMPPAMFDLLVKYRVPNAIIHLLRSNLLFGQSPSQRVLGWTQTLARVAEETGDVDLAACAAFAADRDDFERRAASLGVTDRNVSVLAVSRTRYREAVARLMEIGRREEAELACRLNRDFGLAARHAEAIGDVRDAARSYMEARDYESALRCFLAAGDGRGAARAYERMGRIKEAIDLLESLGLKQNAQRLRKKYPLADRPLRPPEK